MATHEAYLQKLVGLIREVHNCGARHIGTVTVREKQRGAIVWEGEVEVFETIRHPNATHCFAWDHSQGRGCASDLVVMLNLPPVSLPKDAVRNYLARRKT